MITFTEPSVNVTSAGLGIIDQMVMNRDDAGYAVKAYRYPLAGNRGNDCGAAALFNGCRQLLKKLNQ